MEQNVQNDKLSEISFKNGDPGNWFGSHSDFSIDIYYSKLNKIKKRLMNKSEKNIFPETLKYLFSEKEEIFPILESKEISQKKKQKLLISFDWISKICQNHNFSEQTLYKTIFYTKKYFEKFPKEIKKEKIIKVSLSALSLSLKMNEFVFFSKEDFLILTDNNFDIDELIPYENLLLGNVLDFNLNQHFPFEKIIFLCCFLDLDEQDFIKICFFFELSSYDVFFNNQLNLRIFSIFYLVLVFLNDKKIFFLKLKRKFKIKIRNVLDYLGNFIAFLEYFKKSPLLSTRIKFLDLLKIN